MIEYTSFLHNEATISERVYCIKHDITTQPLCKYCGQPLRFHKMDKGYFATCGDEDCKYQAKRDSNIETAKTKDYTESVKKAKATYKAKTGYEHNMQNPEFVKHFFDNIEKKTGERYAIASKRSKEARLKTFQEKYGTTDASVILHSEKAKQTIIEKYGSISEFHKQVKKKSGQTRKNNDFQKLIEKLNDMGYTYISTATPTNSQEYIQIECNRCHNVFVVARQKINKCYRTYNYKFCTKCDTENK